MTMSFCPHDNLSRCQFDMYDAAMHLKTIEQQLQRSHGLFLVADTQLYKRLCLSVGPSVRRSVMIELRMLKMQRILEIFTVIASFQLFLTSFALEG